MHRMAHAGSARKHIGHPGICCHGTPFRMRNIEASRCRLLRKWGRRRAGFMRAMSPTQIEMRFC